jgi:hypothetical protein
MKVVVWIIGTVGGGFVLLLVIGANGDNPQAGTSSSDEVMHVSKRIFATCQQQVLGRQQAQGERISDAQADAITRCVDGMAAAYVEGVKSGSR